MPRIEAVCKSCGHEFLAGDFLPLSKSECPKCKKIGAEWKNPPPKKKFDIIEAARKSL